MYPSSGLFNGRPNILLLLSFQLGLLLSSKVFSFLLPSDELYAAVYLLCHLGAMNSESI